ncbi:unnamed protein product [Diatraea saccharalis]|uniref:YEATS domain-containing protein n=1 Tax=Diatraea saccharalis TaxID=40085 RepID=A0A9P0CAN8_9NEOP|nr:unnamed protein product [Diatraea saccharalis]
MTDGLIVQHEKPMCVRIWLEVGHSCEPRSTARGRALALDWRLWVRGANGRDISAFVHKVVFILRPASAFVYPKRVLQEPPYEIQETGSVSLDIPIDVYLKHSIEPKKIRLRYSLVIEHEAKSTAESRCVSIDVENPSVPLWQALMVGGGEAVGHTNANHRSDRLVIIPGRPAKPTPPRHKFVEPLHCKHVLRRSSTPYALEDTCIKCGESQIELKKQLRLAKMTEDEIERAARLYVDFSGYEKNLDAITLPPISDSIYRIPELPASLHEMMKNAEVEKPLF